MFLAERVAYLDTKTHVFFILTEPCRAQNSEIACDQADLGSMSFMRKYDFVTTGSVKTRSAPGYRIAKYIDPVKFTNADLETHYENQNALKANAIARGEHVPDDDGRYHVRVYIYCPPCACQIATALSVCVYRDKKDLVDFVIRIDHRLKTCCSASFSRVDGLVSVIDFIKGQEKTESLGDWEAERLEKIDREGVEQQIVDYTEENHMVTLSPANQLERIARFHKEEDSCAAIVMLGEADYTIPLMGSPPFPPLQSGPLPRETYIFRNEQKYSQSRGWCWDRVFLGTYTPRTPLPFKKPAPVGSDTAQTPESTQRSSKRPRSSTSILRSNKQLWAMIHPNVESQGLTFLSTERVRKHIVHDRFRPIEIRASSFRSSFSSVLLGLNTLTPELNPYNILTISSSSNICLISFSHNNVHYASSFAPLMDSSCSRYSTDIVSIHLSMTDEVVQELSAGKCNQTLFSRLLI